MITWMPALALTEIVTSSVSDAASMAQWNAEHLSLVAVLWLVIIGCVFIIAAVVKGKWVPGFAFREMKSERDKAIEMAAKSLEVAEKSTDVANRLTAGWKQP